MKNNRRDFLKLASLAALLAGDQKLSLAESNSLRKNTLLLDFNQNKINPQLMSEDPISLIGPYGPWAVSLHEGKLPGLSFRKPEWTNLKKWKKIAKNKLLDRLAIPDLGPVPAVKINQQYEYDGLHIEELSWQLPYGRATVGILLRPLKATGKLPGILAFHDHGGNKYFGTRKITRTPVQHPLMKMHQEDYYEGHAWANEIAKRGYVVLVSDAFPFASRRVMMQDVPQHLRGDLKDEDPESDANIQAYNQWAGGHEHIMAKSLFSAGLTWPGVFFAEDRIALDILCARPEVDAARIGCGGLSGGGMRTVFMGGLDERIKCAVCVGFMTTWNDFVLNKSFTHTWMTYVPILPNELDFPEILGLRVPLPTLVLNDIDDGLYTMPEMKKADHIIAQVYQKADKADHYKCSYYPGPHKFDAGMQLEAFDWFDRWLKV